VIHLSVDFDVGWILTIAQMIRRAGGLTRLSNVPIELLNSTPISEAEKVEEVAGAVNPERRGWVLTWSVGSLRKGEKENHI
jgi:hypothetical protein